MKPFWIGTQLYAGETERSLYSIEELKRAIEKANAIAAFDGLMIWTGNDLPALRALCKASRQNGMETYLWFPAFADTPAFVPEPSDFLVSFEGTSSGGKIAAWEKLGTGDEQFRFICPNNKEAMGRVLQVYKELLESLDIDGVMLDRIRFPSPVNGFESLFGCFCDHCKSRFLEEFKYSMDAIAIKVKDYFVRMKRSTPAELAEELQSPDGLWKMSGLRDLSAFKKSTVFAAARQLAEAARSRNLKVGLDLYSPSLSSLVSQDYAALAGICDWVKPMIYCHAVGPAGLPLELQCLKRGLMALSPKLNEKDATRLLSSMFSWRIPETDDQLLKDGLDEKLVGSELKIAASQLKQSKAKLFAGFEAISIPHYGVSISEHTLERYLENARGLANGVIASWNLLSIPEANLRCIGKLRA